MWGNIIVWIVILGKKIGVKIDSEWINVEMDLFYMKICLKMVQYFVSLILGLIYKKFVF